MACNVSNACVVISMCRKELMKRKSKVGSDELFEEGEEDDEVAEALESLELV